MLFTSGIYAFDFSSVDEIVKAGVVNKSYPGAQLLIGDTKGTVYSKCYGTYTYDSESPLVAESSIFDLASLTKVVAVTSCIMTLYEAGKLDLNDFAGKYIPEFNENGKENITLLNLLLHNSGLKAWEPFYKYCSNKQDVLNAIYKIGLEYPTGTAFVYSDLNFIILGDVVEKVSGESLDTYCEKNIFKPLKMESTMFNPPDKLKKYALPTETDNNLRKRLLQGEVHDEAAWMLKGVSGNAGLFSNSEDLSKFMNMMINRGFYHNPYSRGLKEEKLFKTATVDYFTSKFNTKDYVNTRAPGWDTKPEPTSYRSPCGELISENSFGHTGFTGTSIWCDKERGVYVIFLTNRTYPNRKSNGIREIRPEIHNEIIKIISNN